MDQLGRLSPAPELETRSIGGTFVRSPAAIPLVGSFLLLLHIGLGHRDFDTWAHVGAAALGTLAFVIIRDASPARVPFLPFAAAQFYIFFGTPTFSEQRLKGANGAIFVSDEAKSLAVWAAVLTLSAMYSTAFVGRRFGGWLNPTFERFAPPGGVLRLRGAIRVWSVAALLVRGLILYRAGGVSSSALAFVFSVIGSPILVQALLHREWRDSRSPVSRLWFWAYTLSAVVVGLGTGMLVEVVIPLLGAVVLQWLGSGKLRLRLLVVLAVAYLILAPAKYAYRRETWNVVGRADTQVSISERASAWVKAIEESWGGEQPEVRENVDTGTGRFSALMYAAQTIDWVPHHVPFSGISRWSMIPQSYIPRVLWKDKPDLTQYYNATYAVTFEILSSRGTRTTAVGFFLISDGYWALGWLGVALAGTIVGFLFGTYEGLFRPGHWAGGAIGFAFLMPQQMVGHLGALCGGVLQGIFAFFLALWCIWLFAFLLTERRPMRLR